MNSLRTEDEITDESFEVLSITNEQGATEWLIGLDGEYWVPKARVQKIIAESDDPEAKVVEIFENESFEPNSTAGRWLKDQPDDYTMTAERRDDCWIAIDTSNSCWCPNDEARFEIEASEDPETTVVKMARNSPMRGEWHN